MRVIRCSKEIEENPAGHSGPTLNTNTNMKFNKFSLMLAAACTGLCVSAQEAQVPAPAMVPPEMFTVPDGLEVTVWATSPMLNQPTNIDFDAQGRLFVAEGMNYRGGAKTQPEGDRIIVLEDTTGTGKADKRTVFTQSPDLAAPLGIAVLDDKVVVSQPPDLLVYEDTNHDGIFDSTTEKRTTLLTGFNGWQHDHSLHSVTAGPDGQWYWNQGNNGAQFTDKSGKTFRMGSFYKHDRGRDTVDPVAISGMKSDDGNVWVGGFTARMNPDGSNVKIMGHNYRNSYEQAVTSLGDLFQSDNDDPPACRVSAIMEGGNAGFASADGKRSWGADRRPGQKTPIAEWRQEDPGTMPAGDVYGGGSPTGVAFYENGALGDQWNGLLLACEAARNVVFGYLPKPDGAGFKLERFDFFTSNKEKKFAGSDYLGGGKSVTNELPTLFRPSDVCVGPDGAIYVADWFDASVGGSSMRDGLRHGTIYRIAPKGFKSVVPKIDLNTTEGQIAGLKSPSPNVRYSGFIRLRAQGSKAIPAVVPLLKSENRFFAARALWLLAQMGDEGIAAVKPMLSSDDATLRLVACRALRFVNHDVLAMTTRMATDESAAIRREAALTLRNVPAEKSVPLLLEIAKKFDGKDRAYLEAFGLGSSGKERAVYAALATALSAGPAESWTDAFAWIAWRLHPVEALADIRTRLLSGKLTVEQRKLMLTALGFIDAPDAADTMVTLATAKDFPLRDLAFWWLMNRRNNDWKKYDLTGTMKKRGLALPENAELISVEMPSVNPDAPKLPPVADIAKLAGDATRGATLAAACYTCHRNGESGVDFGPDLTTFGKQQPLEEVIRAIAEPSATISHGFEGTEIKTKDGLTITGMIVADGDPVIIKCMGGLLQTIPKSRIESRQAMKVSLMYPPQQFGLDAQSIADIAAFLKK